MEHLHAGAKPIHDHAAQCPEPLGVNAFDEHAKILYESLR
jgi:hypothetical protein